MHFIIAKDDDSDIHKINNGLILLLSESVFVFFRVEESHCFQLSFLPHYFWVPSAEFL